VERNPVRAGIVSDAGDYAWSSAPTRLSDSDGSEFLDLAPWRRSYSPEQWRDVLERGISEEAQLERIREATRTGRPLGTADFIQSVALQLGRALDRRKAGRPRKDTADRVETQCCLASRNGE
jgi:putative transposase